MRGGKLMRARTFAIFCVSFLLFTAARANAQSGQVMVWPASGSPVLRFTFEKFKEVSNSGNRHNYTSEVTAENLWGKKIPNATFTLYAYDKSKARIGESWVNVNDMDPGAVVKFQTFISASGTIASLSLIPKALPHELQSLLPSDPQPPAPPKPISMTVNSVPQGADVQLDGVPVGTTPKIIQVTPGKHALTFSMEGFNTGTFPLETTPESVSGGSVSYELGTSLHDTIELRDGSVLIGDIESMSPADVVVRIAGANQRISRNKVKRILLVKREEPQ
jgi:hypothetical protein